MDILLFFHRSLRLFTFLAVFFLLWTTGELCWTVLKFTDSIFCHLHYTIETIRWFFFSIIIFLSFIISTQFFNFYLFAEIFYFLFVLREFEIDCWSFFMIVALKFLSHISNVRLVSALTSADHSFSFKLWYSWFLVWWVIFFIVSWTFCLLC